MINKKNIIGVLFILIGVLYIGNAIRTQLVYGLSGNTAGIPVPIVWTHTGTTTTGVGFYCRFTASSTYPVLVGAETDTATLTFKTVSASTTPGGEVAFSILASNDWSCETATTTTIYNYPLKQEINWYDAGTFVVDRSQSLTIPVATTTFKWLPTGANQNKSITLTNLNSRCLALEVNASSTVLFVELMTKQGITK